MPAMVQMSRSRTVGIAFGCEEDVGMLYVDADRTNHVNCAETAISSVIGITYGATQALPKC